MEEKPNLAEVHRQHLQISAERGSQKLLVGGLIALTLIIACYTIPKIRQRPTWLQNRSDIKTAMGVVEVAGASYAQNHHGHYAERYDWPFERELFSAADERRVKVIRHDNWLSVHPVNTMQEAIQAGNDAQPGQIVYCPQMQGKTAINFFVLGKDIDGHLAEAGGSRPMVLRPK